MKQIAELIGVEAFYKLAKEFGGATLYIPKPESLIRLSGTRRSKRSSTGTTTRPWPRSTGSPSAGCARSAERAILKGR